MGDRARCASCCVQKWTASHNTPELHAAFRRLLSHRPSFAEGQRRSERASPVTTRRFPTQIVEPQEIPVVVSPFVEEEPDENEDDLFQDSQDPFGPPETTGDDTLGCL